MSRSLATYSECLAQAAQTSDPLPPRQRMLAMAIALTLLVTTLELVRRRKLREEYAWLWLATSTLVLITAWQRDVLVAFAGWVGAVNSASALFFGGLLFLIAVVLQFSVRLSRLTHRNRTLAQRVALLEQDLAQLRREPMPQATRTIEPTPRRNAPQEAHSA